MKGAETGERGVSTAEDRPAAIFCQSKGKEEEK